MGSAYKGMHGTRRVMAEFSDLLKLIQEGQSPHICELSLVDDNILCWRFKLKNFDEDTPGGSALNSDLRTLNERYHQDHLLLEAIFPAEYPTEPFFLRVISPRCVWYTGHVTAGGSICIEALTQSGTPGSWDPSFTFEAIMHVVTTNMIDCESVVVRTRTGPGGVSGPLRIDLNHRYHYNVMHPYTEMEAKSAFQRTLRHHNQVGWGSQGAGSTGPQTGVVQPVPRNVTAGRISFILGPHQSGSLALPAARQHVHPNPPAYGTHQSIDLQPNVPPAVLKAPVPLNGSPCKPKEVPDWVKGKPKPLKKLFSVSPSPQPALVDDGIFDEVILMLEKEGEKEKNELAEKKAAADVDIGREVVDLASCAGSGSGVQVVETIDLLNSPRGGSFSGGLPSGSEVKPELAGLNSDRQLVDEFVEAASDMLKQEKEKLLSMWEKERRERDSQLAEMERKLRMAKSQSTLVCAPPSNWAPHAEGQNLMITELPIPQPAARRKKRTKTSTPGASGAEVTADEDVSMICEMLKKQGYLERVTRVFRVQNIKLWTKFNLWRSDIQDEVSKMNLNERFLWHGADLDTLGKIANEGFDARVSKLSGSLGGGIYFSESMEYSEQYSRLPAHAVGTSHIVWGKPVQCRKRQLQEMDDFFTAFAAGIDATSQMPVPAAGEVGMFLSRVVLGKSCPGGTAVISCDTRKAPQGYHSVFHQMCRTYCIYAIYDNPQAYPEFLIYFK